MWQKGKNVSCYVICTAEERVRRRKNRARRVKFFVSAALLTIFAVAAWLYWKAMIPTVLDIAEKTVRQRAAFAINSAVGATILSENANDLVLIERNSDGEIVLVAANSAKVNSLAMSTAISAQQSLQRLQNDVVNVPLGTASGLPLLNDKGPNIAVGISPIGSTKCNVSSEFLQAGINQTLHRIYLNVESVVDLVMPGFRSQLTTVTPVLICESVIVGKVPQVYLGQRALSAE